MENKKAKRDKLFREIYEAAQKAGMAAGLAAIPTPMIVGSPSTFMGNDIDPLQPIYHVPEGACGFAWVVVRPGNSSFAKWLKANELADNHYYGGMSIWIGEHGQSVARKEAHADAMAKFLQGLFPDLQITSGSRLD